MQELTNSAVVILFGVCFFGGADTCVAVLGHLSSPSLDGVWPRPSRLANQRIVRCCASVVEAQRKR